MAVDFKFLDFNYPFQSETDVTGTSEDAAFPASNLKLFTRSKVWRSTGSFVVDATNNKLDFDEGGGELTATVTSATYTPSSLATEIATQLTSAGGQTYSVSYSNATGKWTVSAPGAFNLRTLTGTNFATALYPDIGFDVTADTGSATSHTGANIALHTEEAVVFDLKNPQEIDSFALLIDKVSGNKFTTSVALNLQANATDSWTSPAVDVSLTFDTDNDIALHFFASSETYRFWRVKVVDPQNPNLHVELGKVMLAKATALTQNPEKGFRRRSVDLSKRIDTSFGNRFHDIYPIKTFFEFDYKVMSFADFKTLEDMFDRVGIATPIGVIVDTQEDLFDKERFFLYGTYVGERSRTHVVNEFFDDKLVFEELI